MSTMRYLVILPGEYAFDTEAFGPFSTAEGAQRAADRWNAEHPADQAEIITLRPARDLPAATAADTDGGAR